MDSKRPISYYSGNSRSEDAQLLFSTVVQKKRQNLQQAVLQTIHSALREKDKRKSNIIVNGLRQSGSDSDTFCDLCCNEISLYPTVVKTKRLGTPITTKVKPLLVTLHSAETARTIL